MNTQIVLYTHVYVHYRHDPNYKQIKMRLSINDESSSTCRKKNGIIFQCDEDNDLYTMKIFSVKISKAYASSKRRMHLLVSRVLLSY